MSSMMNIYIHRRLRHGHGVTLNKNVQATYSGRREPTSTNHSILLQAKRRTFAFFYKSDEAVEMNDRQTEAVEMNARQKRRR